MNRIAIATIAVLALAPGSAAALSSHGRHAGEEPPRGGVSGLHANPNGQGHGYVGVSKPTAVPEPSTVILLGLGLLGAAGAGWWLGRSKPSLSIARDRIDEAGEQLATPEPRVNGRA